jgi:hypothetical protein
MVGRAVLGRPSHAARVGGWLRLPAGEDSDALITVGGPSVGRHDLLKQVLRRHGELHTWRVALRPAKPFVFGALAGTPVFGPPGNPASALAAYEVIVRPALLAMQGRSDDRSRLQAELTEPFSQLPGRLHMVRALCWVREDRHLVRPVVLRAPAWSMLWPPPTPGWWFPPKSTTCQPEPSSRSGPCGARHPMTEWSGQPRVAPNTRPSA